MQFPSETQYDLFISYASKDDVPPEGQEKGWIRQFVERSQEEHLAFTGDAERELKVFLDRKEIHALHNWRHKLLESCQNSRLFLAFISPNYFASEWCRREWNTWIEAEIGKHILSEGAAMIYIVEVPWLHQKFSEQDVTAQLDELFDAKSRAKHPDTLPADSLELAKQIGARQQTDVKHFYNEGIAALRNADMEKTLKELSKTLDQQAQRIKDGENSFSSVPVYNKNFTGRLTELTKLWESLDDRKTGVITSIHGLGGIGKTELAFTYAHAYACIYPGGRYLIECEGHEDLRQPIMNSLGPYFGAQLSEPERMDPQRYFAGIVANLRRHAHEKGRTLLLLDNVDKESLLEKSETDQITDTQGHLHLLFTTRLGNFSIKNSDTTWITLNSLPARDALALLYKFRPVDPIDEPEEHQAAQAIVDLLDGFTLAIELIAAYLGEEEESNFVGILVLLEDDQEEVLTGLSDDQRAQSQRHNHEKHLGTILDFSLKRLTPVARTALQYAAHLPPDAIVIPWLKELALKHHPEINDGPQPGNPNSWAEALKQLHSLTLLTPGEGDEADNRIERLHRLVASHLIQREREIQHPRIEGSILNLVVKRDQFLRNQYDWEKNRWEVPPLEELALLWDEQSKDRAAWLLNQVGISWQTLNDWSRAEPLLRRALYITENRTDITHSSVSTYLINLAGLLTNTNRLNEAEPLIRRALSIDRNCFGPSHPNFAGDLNTLADLLKNTNRYDEAEPLFRRALFINEECLGKNHPEVARDLIGLSSLLTETNRQCEAEPLIRRALEIDENWFGKKHPRTTRSLACLALLLMNTNRLDEAEPIMRRALQIDENSFHKYHQTVAIHLNNLASLLKESNRHDEAEPLIRRALDIDETNFGQDHPRVATDLNNLALLLIDTKRHNEAETLIRRALQIDKNSSGEMHPSVARDLSNLALIFQATNRLDQAEPLLFQALEIDENSFGENHPNVAGTLCILAQLLQDTDRIYEAESLMRRSLKIIENSFDENHPMIAAHLNNLASLLFETARFDEAEPLMKRMIIILLLFGEKTGHEHPHFRTSFHNYLTLLRKNSYSDADRYKKIEILGLEGGWKVEDWKEFLDQLTTEKF